MFITNNYNKFINTEADIKGPNCVVTPINGVALPEQLRYKLNRKKLSDQFSELFFNL
jgi:hypothetical protein